MQNACAVLYCHLSSVRLYNNFPHHLINGYFLLKNQFLNVKCVLWFFQQILSKPCLNLRRTEQDMIKNVYWCTRYSCLILIKLEFSRHDFEKFSNTKFHENPFSMSRVVTCGRTVGRTDMTKLIVAFRNFAKAPQNGVRFFAADIWKLTVWRNLLRHFWLSTRNFVTLRDHEISNSSEQWNCCRLAYIVGPVTPSRHNWITIQYLIQRA